MARNARQHETTRIKWSSNPETDAKALATVSGGTAKQARLLGEVVWGTAHTDGTFTVQLHHTQGRKIGLCMYHWCPRRESDCNFHKAQKARRRRGD